MSGGNIPESFGAVICGFSYCSECQGHQPKVHNRNIKHKRWPWKKSECIRSNPVQDFPEFVRWFRGAARGQWAPAVPPGSSPFPRPRSGDIFRKPNGRVKVFARRSPGWHRLRAWRPNLFELADIKTEDDLGELRSAQQARGLMNIAGVIFSLPDQFEGKLLAGLQVLQRLLLLTPVAGNRWSLCSCPIPGPNW